MKTSRITRYVRSINTQELDSAGALISIFSPGRESGHVQRLKKIPAFQQIDPGATSPNTCREDWY